MRIGGFHDHYVLDALATLVLSDFGENKLGQFVLAQDEPRHTIAYGQFKYPGQ
jgi:hypothetical protein